MKQQSIKSLKEQTKNINIKEFIVEDFSRGAYGYNAINGVLDGKIKVGFAIPYQKDNDTQAEHTITQLLNTYTQRVRTISVYCPALKEYDEACLMFVTKIVCEIEGKLFTIYIEKVPVRGDYYKPLFTYGTNTPTAYMQNLKISLAKHITNFKIILRTKHFAFEKCEIIQKNEFTEITDDDGNKKCVFAANSYYRIDGVSYGQPHSFEIRQKALADVNMKWFMKNQLEYIKKTARGRKHLNL